MKTWRELDPATRKALLRGEPATDPEIDRVARAYAEKTLQRSAIRTGLIVVPSAAVVGALLGALAAAADLTPTIMVVLPALIVGVVVAVLASRRKLALIRLLNVSRGAPRELVVPGSSERVEIRVPTSGFLRTMTPLLALVVPLLALGAVWPNPWLRVTAVVVAVPLIAYIGYMLLAWSLPGHPAYVLDSDGVHTPKYGLRVGWESVREIRVVPLRATARDTRKVIAFMLDDDQVYLRQLPSWQAFFARTNKRTYLSPMIALDGMVDKPIDEIAASAAALSGLPVSGPQPR
ncbi:hypothetical protein [Nocardia lijiangensis]|uniref:hypothetical protein n=1 Tax=Nocardia lijiangensis TaxID=299618 RepID=UPI003D73E17A